MPTDFAIPAGTLYSFLLVLTRITGVFIFIPLPALKAGPEAARLVLSFVVTLSLYAKWPKLPNAPAGLGEFLGWMLIEAIIGIAIGLGVAFLLETIQVAAQAISLQAGFSYASTVDPTNNADSTVLLVAAQLIAGLLFFTAGLDRQLLTIFAGSLDSQPPGTLVMNRAHVESFVMAGAGIFTTGLRLALPVMTLLLLLDLSMGLLSRLNAQLQVLSLTLPLKMVAALIVLSWGVLLYPRVFGQSASFMFAALRQLLAL